MWAGRGRVFVGRDTRGSGPALETAVVEGIVSAGGIAVCGGVLPTPAVALLAQDLGIVLSASHNPPEYNGVKFFTSEGHKLSDEEEEEIEVLLGAPGHGRGSVELAEDAPAGYVAHILEHFGSDLAGLRIAVDCANGAFSAIAPAVFEQLGAAGDDRGGSTRRIEHQRGLRCDGSRPAAGGRANRRVRSRGCVRRRRRSHARGRRDRRGSRRRSDPRHPRARAGRRHRCGDDDDQPRFPQAHGRTRRPGADDRCRGPARARGDARRGSTARRRAVRACDHARRPRDRGRVGRCAAPL